MSPQAKFELKWITLVLTIIGMFCGAMVWTTKTSITYGKEQATLENTIKEVNSHLEHRITNIHIDLAEHKSRYMEHCEKSQKAFEAIKEDVDSIEKNQAVIINTQKQIHKSVEKIEQKLP